MKMDMTTRKKLCLVSTFLVYFFSCNCLHAAFEPIVYPGTPQGFYTCAFGINDSGECVGEYANPTGHYGFSWDGTNYSTLNVPGTYTVASGINNNNFIVGINNRTDAFVIDNAGYRPFGYPGTPMGINDAGNIVGSYVDGGKYRGFLVDASGFHHFDYPGAANTYANAINNLGHVVGEYRLADNISRGFIFDGTNFSDSTQFSSIKVPNNAPGVANSFLIPYGINDSGVVVGVYGSYFDGWYQRGFIVDGEEFSLVSYPGADRTSLSDINNDGQVVGWFDDNSYYNASGFRAERADMIPITLPVPVPNQVPLPGAVLLLGAGLGRLVLYRRRRLTGKN